MTFHHVLITSVFINKYIKKRRTCNMTEKSNKDHQDVHTSEAMTETLITLDASLTPSEERRRTGRYVAVALVVVACLLGLHHAFVKQNAVLAGLIVPALIMVFYILWVLHTAKKATYKHADFEVMEVPTVIIKEATPSPTDSNTSIPMPSSTSGILNNGADVP